MLETLLQPNDTQERCGFILKDGSILAITNIAADKESGFEMNPLEMLPFVAADLVEATWHTHPGAGPEYSGEDHSGFLAWPDLKHYVVGISGVKCYRVDNGVVLECD